MVKLRTQAEFIERARRIHSDKYDYHAVTYIDCKEIVQIDCRIHGPFWMTPDSHLNQRHGCTDCGKRFGMDHDVFLSRAAAKHGGKYEYSKTVYSPSSPKVTVTCSEHGDFTVNARIHLEGDGGCKMCRRNDRLNFLERARAKHGGRYYYSKTKDFSSVYEKIPIQCPEHGVFHQSVNSHLCGSGCSQCSRALCVDQTNFLTRAKRLHGDRYGYSKAECTEANSMVWVTCQQHGDFRINASKHLRGSGCRECQYDDKRMSTEDFVAKAKLIHGSKYNYVDVVYGNYRSKVDIGCPVHGHFSQAAGSHLQGFGCPRCGAPIRHSKPSAEWLKALQADGLEIQHTGNGGEYRIPGTAFHVDGFCHKQNLVLEFNG